LTFIALACIALKFIALACIALKFIAFFTGLGYINRDESMKKAEMDDQRMIAGR